MIPKRYIEEWKEFAPWPDNAQIEQDLIQARALAEIFSDEMLNEHLAFRGGTALHKLYLKPPVRYSEDIDLVQIKEGAIKPILQRIRERLAFLGNRRTVKPKAHNHTIVYRFESETSPVINMRLKIEINCREHFTVMGLSQFPFEIKNGWFSRSCTINTYFLEELLGTKLRALYQRKKGRDLFDLFWALSNQPINIGVLVDCYKTYMEKSEVATPTQRQFQLNMEDKMTDKEFLTDIVGILRPGAEYENEKAYNFFKSVVLDKL